MELRLSIALFLRQQEAGASAEGEMWGGGESEQAESRGFLGQRKGSIRYVAGRFADVVGRRRQEPGCGGVTGEQEPTHRACERLGVTRAHREGGRKESHDKRTAWSPGRVPRHSDLAPARPSPEDASLQSPPFSLGANATFPRKPF